MRSRAAAAVMGLLVLGVAGLCLPGRPAEQRVARAQSLEAWRLDDVWPGDAGQRPVGFVRQPGGMAVAADGTVYLVDVDRGRVHVWRDGAFVDVLGAAGSGPGALSRPHGLAIAGGELLVADTGHGRVQRWTTDGRPIAVYEGLGEPWDVAVTGDGLVLVSDRAGDRVLVLDEDGRRLGSVGGSGSEPGRLRGPLGIDAWPDGRFAVVDAGNRRVQVLSLDGTPSALITDTSDLPLIDVAVAADNELLVAGLRRVVRYDLAGPIMRAISGAPVPGGFTGVATVPDPSGTFTGTMYAALNHDYLTGVRRFTGGVLYPHEDFLALPGPAGELSSPRRIAVGSGVLTLLDAWPRLVRWSPTGAPLSQVGLESASDAEPAGQETILARSGEVRRMLGSDEHGVWRPMTGTVWTAGIAYDPVLDRTWAVDLRGQAVRVLDRTMAEVGVWSLADAGAPGAYQSITDIAYAGSDRLMLVNRSRGRIETRSGEDGALLSTWPVQGVPLRVAPDPGGGAFVLTREGWIWRLDAAGRVRAWWSVADATPDRAAAPADLALGEDGRLLVVDSSGDRVLLFALDPAGVPAEPPPDTGCTFTRDKRAGPGRIPLGETVGVTLTLAGVCVDQGAEVDVMLVLDRSGSMRGAKMEAARSSAVAFLGEMDFSVARVGMVLFDVEATLAMSLTADAGRLVDAVAAIAEPNGGTDIGEGIEVAATHLALLGRPGVRQAIVVLSDGRPEGHDVDADQAAAAAKAAGVRLYSIGFGPDVDPDLMRRVASQVDDYFFAPSPAELSGIYSEIARRIAGGVVARDMVVTDVVPANMEYQAGSAQPPITSYDLGVLRWDVPLMTANWSASYRLRPLQTGIWPTNVEASSVFRDGFDRAGRVVFPVPRVEVYAPAEPLYLPLLQRHVCWQRSRHADVVLVLDTSSSMTGDKLQAAKDAARSFVELLDLPWDQASIVGFNIAATLASPLTGDRDRLRGAIDGLFVTPGTVVDAGLRMATEELRSGRAREGNSRVVVLLTDGVNNAGRDPVLRAAAEAHASGLVLYTVAFGADADRTLMRQVAGDPSRAYLALGAADLRRIYGEIAGRVGCEP